MKQNMSTVARQENVDLQNQRPSVGVKPVVRLRSKDKMIPQTLRECFELLLKTFRPPPLFPHPKAGVDRATLRHQDLRIVERKFYMQWFVRPEIRYRKAELRRRALQGMVSCLFYANKQSGQKESFSDHS